MGNARHGPAMALVRTLGAAIAMVAVLVLAGPAHAQVVTTTTSTTLGAPAPPPVVDDPLSRLSGISGGVSQPDTDVAAPTTVAGASDGGDQQSGTPAPSGDPTAGPTATTVPGPPVDPGAPQPAPVAGDAGAANTNVTVFSQAGAASKSVGRGGTSAPVALVVTMAVAAGLAVIAARWFTHRSTD